jgi:hypothetical protein
MTTADDLVIGLKLVKFDGNDKLVDGFLFFFQAIRKDRFSLSVCSKEMEDRISLPHGDLL